MRNNETIYDMLQTKQKKNFLKIKENLSLYPKNKLTTIHSE